jgi:hypothetical protein
MDLDDPALRYVPPAGWRERIDARVDPRRARQRRIAHWLLIALVHLGLLHRLQQAPIHPRVQPERERAVTVVWFDARLPAPPPPSPRKSETPRESTPERRDDAPRRVQSAPPDPILPRDTPALSAQTPRLFAPDGALLLPDTVRGDLATTTDPRSRFDFKVPGVLEERTRTPRPAALTYEATRFEDAWIEEQDPVSTALAKAVEKTTITVRIPLPRAPGSKVVCKFAILAAAGGCGITNLSDGYFVRLDDPDTLDPAEDAQCQQWWDAMASASTDTQWLAARDRFEAHCRKSRVAAQAAAR